MKFNQALVIYKHLSSISSSKRRSEGEDLHLRTLDILYPLLREYGIFFSTCSTKQLQTIGSDIDLVITIGGDGTVLTTSHFVKDQPILGIKSYGKESIGYFCAASTQTMNLYLKSLLTGHIKPKTLNRLELTIGRHKVKELALNDVLFSHAMPASTTRYKITVGKKSEMQRSSGIWISSAAGSTAAVSAAGGHPLPLGSRKMEYVVREPYAPSTHYKMLQGVGPDKNPIKILSLTNHGIVFIDGSHLQYPAPEGTLVTIKGAKKPLKIFWKK